MRRVIFLLLMVSAFLPRPAAGSRGEATPEDSTIATHAPSWARPRLAERADDREAMVKALQRYRWVPVTRDVVLDAMRAVPRHRFVPRSQERQAYADSPLPIGHGQTISQPYIVALMTELAEIAPEHKVLEVGTGSGYQAAVLNELTPKVFTIEIIEPLAARTGAVFKELGYENLEARAGDGYFGWPEEAPFDRILVTAAARHIPPPLLSQLRPGGRMVIPVGPRWGGQELLLVTKDAEGKVTTRSVLPVRFVPLVGGKD